MSGNNVWLTFRVPVQPKAVRWVLKSSQSSSSTPDKNYPLLYVTWKTASDQNHTIKSVLTHYFYIFKLTRALLVFLLLQFLYDNILYINLTVFSIARVCVCVCRYVISTLELMVAEDYMIVYLNGATPRRRMPGFTWMKKCYQMIDRRWYSHEEAHSNCDV